jgi:hypothetical protein
MPRPVVPSAVMWKQDVRAIGDDEIRRHVDSQTLDFAGLNVERPRVDHQTGAEHAQDAFMKDARRDQMQHQLSVAPNDRVARVVSAVETRHDLERRRDEIDDLPFAFVSPLPANDRDIRHGSSSKGP